MKFGLVAGEASGDLLGAGLISAIRERVPDARFEGVAGPTMIAAGCERWEDAEVLAVMGLVEPIREIPKLLKLRRMLAKRWIADPPDVFIGIDAPEFNLGLEVRLKSAEIPTAHYVSPSVWAWREGRLKKIRKAADCVLCILPFEKKYYDEHDIPATFVGHPNADAAPETVDTAGARQVLGYGVDTAVIAVLPGSRKSEVTRLSPIFAKAAALLLEARPELRFVTPAATPALRAIIAADLLDVDVADAFQILDNESEIAMTAADVVLLASGTAALEGAMLQKPMVASYRVSAATAAIIRTLGLLKIDKFTLPNLLTESPLIPEFIQEEATPEGLAAAILELLEAPERRAAISARFAKLRNELALDANRRAADAVLGLARA